MCEVHRSPQSTYIHVRTKIPPTLIDPPLFPLFACKPRSGIPGHTAHTHFGTLKFDANPVPRLRPLHLPPAPPGRLAGLVPTSLPDLRGSSSTVPSLFLILPPLGLPCFPPYFVPFPSSNLASLLDPNSPRARDAADLLPRLNLLPTCLIGMLKPSRPRMFHLRPALPTSATSPRPLHRIQEHTFLAGSTPCVL